MKPNSVPKNRGVHKTKKEGADDNNSQNFLVPVSQSTTLREVSKKEEELAEDCSPAGADDCSGTGEGDSSPSGHLIKKTKPITRKQGPPAIADVNLRTKFTHEMADRAREDGMHPVELLYAIAADPSITFTDWLPSKGKLIRVERTATPNERIDCAKAVLPYIAVKKVEVAHSGTVQVLHALAESVLDATELDDEGNVIDTEFSELDE